MKRPSALVVSVVLTLVEVLVISTLAEGTTPPLGSVTVPCRDAVTNCAVILPQNTASENTALQSTTGLLRINISLKLLAWLQYQNSNRRVNANTRHANTRAKRYRVRYRCHSPAGNFSNRPRPPGALRGTGRAPTVCSSWPTSSATIAWARTAIASFGLRTSTAWRRNPPISATPSYRRRC